MRTAVAIAVLATVAGSMWIAFELLARASERAPVRPWSV
jgi:hypothetical protein